MDISKVFHCKDHVKRTAYGLDRDAFKQGLIQSGVKRDRASVRLSGLGMQSSSFGPFFFLYVDNR